MIEQRGYWHDRHYQRLVARGDKQYWTDEDVEALKAKVRRIRKREKVDAAIR